MIVVETKTFRILEDVADLEEKIKKYEDEQTRNSL